MVVGGNGCGLRRRRRLLLLLLLLLPLAWLEDPAVTLPSGLKAGLSLASLSRLVPSRGPSSRRTTAARSVPSPPTASVSTGTWLGSARG